METYENYLENWEDLPPPEKPQDKPEASAPEQIVPSFGADVVLPETKQALHLVVNRSSFVSIEHALKIKNQFVKSTKKLSK